MKILRRKSQTYQHIDRPVVRYVNKIIIDAIISKSSDIHFETYETFYRVRYRQDVILYKLSKPPLQLVSVL